MIIVFISSYEAPKPKSNGRQKNGSRGSLNRNSNNHQNNNGVNHRSSSSTPSPPLPPVRTSSNVGMTTPFLNGHQGDDDIERITVEDNRSKFAIYSLPNKPRKMSREKKISNDVPPMALSKLMPLLISNGHHEDENGNEDSSNHSNEEPVTSRLSNGLPPQYPNRAGKILGNKLKSSNNFVPDYQNYNGSQEPTPNLVTNGVTKNDHSVSSSVPRRQKRRSKRSVNEKYSVDSDIEHHILYGKETTL